MTCRSSRRLRTAGDAAAATPAAGRPGASRDGNAGAAPESRPDLPRAPADLGSEYLEGEEGDDDGVEAVSATVEEVWKGGSRLLFFRFSNGQIWRQMESGYFYYPRKGSFSVTIRQGFMGDYQMRLAGRGRMTRIVRVQ